MLPYMIVTGICLERMGSGIWIPMQNYMYVDVTLSRWIRPVDADRRREVEDQRQRSFAGGAGSQRLFYFKKDG